MKKVLVSIVGVLYMFSAFSAGENVPTSKAYVDYEVSQKQDKIPANVNGANGPDQVLTNTGIPGSVGTKNIYDSSAAYATQTDALVDAGTFNAAVQNAIEAEFKCISWVDDDPTKDCLLVQIVGPDVGIQLGDGEWVRAWLTSDTAASGQLKTLEYYEDASSTIRIPIEIGTEYKMYWDAGYDSRIYRVGFVKTDSIPTADNRNIPVYKADGTRGQEFISNSQTYPSYTFTVTDNDIKYLVVQINGSNEAWNNGDFSVLWDRISHLHLVRNNFLPAGN